MHDLLDLKALCGFLAPLAPEFSDPAEVEVEPFSGGVSNLTAILRCRGRELVLRRPPPGKKAATAHDMVREAAVLKKIRPHFPLAPEVVAVGEDPSILGAPFFVMERIRGLPVGRSLPARLSPEQARALCEGVVDLHAQLHAIDIEAAGLSGMGKPEGYVRRQVEGWAFRYRAARTDDVPSFEAIIGWLEEHQPGESGACLIHNDFKMDNLLLDEAEPTRVVGVVDWEMATVGDPLMDLGASLAYWVERGDPEPLRAIRTQPSTVPGMLTRGEIVARYAERSGRAVGDSRFYYVYGLFRLAGIAQQIYARYKLGQTRDERVARFGEAVRVLSDQAHRVIREGRGE